MAVVLDDEERGNPLHANEAIAGLVAAPAEWRAAVVGKLQDAVRRLGLGANDPGMHVLRGRIDLLAANAQGSAARITGVRLAERSQPTVQRCVRSAADW